MNSETTMDQSLTDKFVSDIPLSLAVSAFNGVSMSPERRGDSTRSEYGATLAQDYLKLKKAIENKPHLAETVEAEFERYRQGYRKRYLAYLHSSSRCVSSFIAGPSNFPAHRMNKRADIAHKRLTEFLEFRTRALEAINRTLHPEWRPIMAGDSDACERLKADIEKAEKVQAVMVACNAALRKNLKNGREVQVKAISEALLSAGYSGDCEARANQLLTPDCFGGLGFAHFELSNNSANIRRMKARLEQISRNKAAPQVEIEGSNARFEDCPSENRVRLFFPGKPAADIRERLKSAGFRWSPTIGAWQAYRNSNSIQTAKREAGIEKPELVNAKAIPAGFVSDEAWSS